MEYNYFIYVNIIEYACMSVRVCVCVYVEMGVYLCACIVSLCFV